MTTADILLTSLEIVYGLVMAGSGAGGALWLTRARRVPVGDAGTAAQPEMSQASEVLARLYDLTTKVAVDVEMHSNRVEEINDSLIAQGDQPAMIVDQVARLIQANQQMQEKLATTEDRLREQAQQIQTHVAEARTDALTMLANRRALDDELQRRLAEFQRQGRPFSLALADIDHFKRFNDTYGHQAGDEVLRGVGKALRRKMREMDLVARYGGEEFAMVLCATPIADARTTAGRGREAIEKFHFRAGGQELQVTGSFGVAEIRPGENIASLIERADKALYASKEAGRNCVHWHDGRQVLRLEAASRIVETVIEEESPTAVPAVPKVEPTPAAPPDASPCCGEPEPSEGFGLPSRTAFCQQARTRLAEWQRGGPAFSIILAEVNPYETVGTKLQGPLMRAAARLTAGVVRDMDLSADYGPGCFGLLLPTARLADAIRVAERLREEGERCRIRSAAGAVALSLSVGVVQTTEGDDSMSLLTRAETALDAADRHGGNSTYFHDGQRCAPITSLMEAMNYLS